MTISKTIRIFFKISAKEVLTYRGTMLLWMFSWFMSFITMSFLWRSAQASGSIAGYSVNQLITYYFIGILIWSICGWYVFNNIIREIKDGSIINFIIKPISFHWYHFSAELAWHTINFIFLILFFLAIFIFSKNYIVLNFDPLSLILFVFSLGIGCFITFEFNMLLGMAAFWLVNANGLGSFYWFIMSLLGGMLLPINFFPEHFRNIINLLPFRFMYAFPIEIYLKQISPKTILVSFAVAIFWILIIYKIYKIAWQKGIKIYTGYGQ